MTQDKVARINLRIRAERARQERLHTGKTCADGVTDGFRLSVLVEEVGEVAKAMQEGDRKNLKDELTQVAAVAVAWLESMDD